MGEYLGPEAGNLVNKKNELAEKDGENAYNMHQI